MKSADLAFVFARVVAVALTACGSTETSPSTPDPTPGVDAGVDGGNQVLLEGGAKLDANPDDKCSIRTYTPVPADTCGDFVTYPCGLPPDVDIRPGCFLGLNDCASLCPDVHYSCQVYGQWCDADAGKVIPDEAGAVVVDCSICKGSAGRRPAGLRAVRPTSTSPLGAWLAETAHLEAASVHAFRRLALDLRAHGAPASLIDGCMSAIGDEIRHARAVGRLARKFGGRYAKPRVADVGDRSLADIARENAIEGCVRETFAAVVATWQSQHALPEIAEVFARIAEDETRHAALSWSVAEWAMPRLDAATRASIVAACEAAVRVLDQVASVDGAGLPDAATSRLLAGAVTELLPILSRATENRPQGFAIRSRTTS